MEEVKEMKERAEEMISVEQANAQIQNIVKQANERISQLAAQLQNVESLLRDKVVEHLFHVIKYSHYFETEFVDNCASAITKYLVQTALTEEEPKDAETPVESTETPKPVTE